MWAEIGVAGNLFVLVVKMMIMLPGKKAKAIIKLVLSGAKSTEACSPCMPGTYSGIQGNSHYTALTVLYCVPLLQLCACEIVQHYYS
jgi:hypothetical protein